MAISLGQICDAIEATLATAVGMGRTQSYDELTEGVVGRDCPLLQVYPARGSCDVTTPTTERTTFQAGVRQKEFEVRADLYARPRSHLKQDMKAVTDMIDAIIDVLEVQNVKPYFGVGGVGIKAFRWRWERAVFEYEGGTMYMGARFFITCRIF